MLTRCPQCETIFRVSKKHISAAKGLVRCGSCKDIFNAKEHVIKSKKDLKKPSNSVDPTTEISINNNPNTAVEIQAQSNTNINENITTKVSKPIINKITKNNNELQNTDSQGFDFLKDGFISTDGLKKFNTSIPQTTPSTAKKPSSKAEAISQTQTSNFNFDSVFSENESGDSTNEVIIVKKSSTANNIESKKIDTPNNNAKFSSKNPQPHHATAVNSVTTKKPNKAEKFISQNVIDIKNAFSSLSKKITKTVAKKIKPEKIEQKNNFISNKAKNTSQFVINENSLTAKSSVTSTKTVNTIKPKKPLVMSLDSKTNIYSKKDNNTESNSDLEQHALVKTQQENIASLKEVSKKLNTNKPTVNKTQQEIPSTPKVKTKPQLKEQAALKLAIKLKEAAKLKAQTKSIAAKKTTNTNNSIAKKTIEENKIIIPNVPKKVTNNLGATDKKPTNKAITNKSVKAVKAEPAVAVPANPPGKKIKPKATEKQNPTLISKEDSELNENSDSKFDTDVHIHMETIDIPMVLRDSLEVLEIPSRSVEMTVFIISSLFLLVLGLLLQFAVFRSIEIQQKYPSLKPIISQVCNTFNCAYSGTRDIKKIQLISRDIRVHPSTQGALLISATIINKASYQQPYPNFSVTLSNLAGKVVAQRFFSPTDYLGRLSDKLLLMPPKQPIRVALEVVDPGKEAINFEFKFLSSK